MPSGARRQVKYRLALVLTVLLVGMVEGCTQYVYFPVELHYERLSPVYVLRLRNETGVPLTIEPSTEGMRTGFTDQSLPPGGSFEVAVQVRAYKVGSGSSVGSHQIVDNPYVAQAGANTGVIRVRHGELYEFAIDVRNESWFARVSRAGPEAPRIEAVLSDFNRRRWFLEGPGGPP